ncbi:TetR family transcriptional regulator [Micromonospora endolithica]|nr:TetR family transcriptional regulator [Micromonospora endolithica]
MLARDRAAPLSAVAQAASISRATLHRMYPNRDVLVEAIVERACREARAVFDLVDMAHSPVPDAIRDLVRRLMPIAHLWALAINEPLMDQVPRFAEDAAELEQRLVELMRRGQRDGVLRTDQSARWMTFFFGMALTAAHHAVASGFLAPREAPDLVVSSVLHGISGSPAP